MERDCRCMVLVRNWRTGILILKPLCGSLSLVLCVGEGGYLKGSVRGSVGWFPAECVEEVPTQAQEDRPCECTQTHNDLNAHHDCDVAIQAPKYSLQRISMKSMIGSSYLYGMNNYELFLPHLAHIVLPTNPPLPCNKPSRGFSKTAQ